MPSLANATATRCAVNGRGAAKELLQIILAAMNVPRTRANRYADEMVSDAEEAIARAASGTPFGFVSVWVNILDEDARRADLRARELVRRQQNAGIGARIEDVNSVEAYKGSQPGNGWSDVSRPLVSGINFAHLALVSEPRPPPLIGGGAASHQIPFPPPPFQLWVRRAAAEDGAEFPSPSHVRSGRRQAGAKGEFRSVVTSAIRAGPSSGSSAHALGASVRFIRVSWLSTFPKERSLYCEAEECAKAASWEFSAQVFDDESNTSMWGVKSDVSGKLWPLRSKGED